MRRTLLFALGGFLVPTIVALLVLGARSDDSGPGEGLETFEHSSFPFTFSYPEEFREASAEGGVRALSLEGANTVTVQEIEPFVPRPELAAYVAQLLVDEGASATEVSRSDIPMLTARIPRAVGGTEPAESLLYFFSARGGTFQLDCQFTDSRRRQVVQACKRVTKTVELD